VSFNQNFNFLRFPLLENRHLSRTILPLAVENTEVSFFQKKISLIFQSYYNRQSFRNTAPKRPSTLYQRLSCLLVISCFSAFYAWHMRDYVIYGVLLLLDGHNFK
jgi:hypothetical protein